MNLTLIVAILTLALWVLLTFVTPVGVSITHLLIIVSVILFSRRVVLGKTRW